MIFVSVGTHEQGFDRLVMKMDELVENGVIREEVYIQAGYTEYKPRFCKYDALIDNRLMEENVKNARIVITHAGPGSIMIPFTYNKIPIVVPRQYEFGEHVDDHQVWFTKKLEEQGKILAVYDINDLKNAIQNYDKLSAYMVCNFHSNAEEFTEKVEKICESLLTEKRRKKKKRWKK